MYAVEHLTHPPGLTPASRTPVAALHALPNEMVFNGRDEWQAYLQQHLLPLQCMPVDPQGFRSNAVIARLCGNTVAELRVDASRLARRDIGGDEGSPVKVMWQLAGRSRIRQGPNSAPLDAGSWTICNAGREYVVDFDQGARCLLILVPRSQCTGWLTALDSLAALPLSAGGPAHIAKSMLVSMLREGADLDARSERALHDSVVALVEHALQVELGKRGLSARISRQVDVDRVRAYVVDHIGDKALTVERVAAVFGMSRRNLYNVFARFGATPHTFIQDARLDRARTLLGDPAWRRAPVVRIAEQCGFADAAHFSRAFHSRYGAAPNAWRDRTA